MGGRRDHDLSANAKDNNVTMDTPFLENRKQTQLASLEQRLTALDAIKHQYEMDLLTAITTEKIQIQQKLTTDVLPKIQQLEQEIAALESESQEHQPEPNPAYIAASRKLEQLLTNSGDLSHPS